MLEATPQPFDKNVVQCPALSIHADADVGIFPDSADEGFAGELGTFISIEDFRCSIFTESLLQARHTERAVHGI